MNTLPSRLLRALLIVFAVCGAFAWLGTSHSVRAKTVTWESFVVDLHLREDGSFHIEETQTVDFAGGPFQFAFAEIPLTRRDDLINFEVWEIRDGNRIPYQQSDSEDDETFTIERTSAAVTITWFMPRTFDEVRTFVLAYDVIGGLRVYDTDQGQMQQIWWTPITEDITDIAPIENAEFNVYLPTAVDPSNVRIDGPGSNDPAEHTVDGIEYTWQAGALGSGDELDVRIEFPAIVNASVPAWQVEDDERRLREQDREARNALLKLIMAGAALLTAIAGGVGLFGLWYTRGRDPGVGLVADYLSEPPDDLPPGAAGALIDEHVNQRDIVATLTDLGHRGVLSIQEKKGEGLFSRRDYE
ncbi:MAG: DUF2207 domain-containing protein, partial [Chloroflexota bacterium]|nr:DUF2207 domain-containing protein [Chloroflexota bacterium]